MPVKPLLSVIIVVERQGARFHQTLDSLQIQTLRDFELIVIDNASKVDVWEALLPVKIPRVRVHRFNQPRPYFSALSTAHQWVNGTYIAYHGGGSSSASERFERQVALLNRRKEVAAVTCGVEWRDSQGAVLRSVEVPSQHLHLVKLLGQENCLTHGSMMLRRSAFEAVGGYRQELDLAAGYDLWLRLADEYKLGALQTTLYRNVFSMYDPAIVQHDEVQAYEGLVRQLAGERLAHGEEITGYIAGAGQLAERSHRKNFISRRIKQAENYREWVKIVAEWQGATDAFLQALNARARQLWLFSSKG